MLSYKQILVYVSLFLRVALAATGGPQLRNVMYLTGQHPIVPPAPQVSSVTHVILAFMRSATFNDANPNEWPLFTTVNATRDKFAPGTKIMIAIGGWGDTQGFADAARTAQTRTLFAENIARMVSATGADGVDIDWEYPGGNGADYKTTPNPTKAWEIPAYPLLLSTIRSALPAPKLISAAVPGLPRDMLAFTPHTLPSLLPSLSFLNIMTYDLMNRRDAVTAHHTGVQSSLRALDAYHAAGVPYEDMNLGFAFYVKWFETAVDGGCDVQAIGCRAALMEDPATGEDLGRAGAFAWHDEVPGQLDASFTRAMGYGVYDEEGGGQYFWDGEEGVWWSWDTPEAILRKFPAVVERRGVGGVFAWGLGEDGDGWVHLDALNEGVEGWRKRRENEGGERDEL
ncbi:glycoside hydrolase [Polyplosphaeria fusca]|uniref:chitinase n=1 Tax=Polyplosphaeria fusca TaxID=682080 RepID=A0A9P4QKD9_9PLEO|nr:glycoside hydrolase [Polyplosphaeria fusca]